MSLQEKRLALETQIVERALADEGFKERLLKNPHGAIAELGVRIPKDVEDQKCWRSQPRWPLSSAL